MNSTLPLTGAHLRTYDRIFQHPLSHNLEWRDVRALFDEIGQIAEEPNGNLKVTRNGLTFVLHPQRNKNISTNEEVMAIRHFLIHSDAAKAPASDEAPAQWLLVIDHHEARIFRTSFSGAVPEQIFPHGPGKYFRHAQHSEDFSRGKEIPDHNSFFQPIAAALDTKGSIVVFGTGTGEASEMDQFVKWAKVHHPELALRVIGTLAIDENHLQPNQLLAQAREFYAQHKGDRI